MRDAPRLTHLGVTQITVISRHKPLICQAANYEGHMHPVLIQKQNFAHLPAESKHVRQQLSSGHAKHNTAQHCVKAQKEYKQSKFHRNYFK